jgi:hypothetical protein
MNFKTLLEKHYTLLEQENTPQGQNVPETPETPQKPGMGEEGLPEQDDQAKQMQEMIEKSQRRVYDMINNIVSYIREASTDRDTTRLSPELESFLKNLEEASLNGADYTSKLSEMEKVINSNLGKGLYEPASEITGESFFQSWKNAK